MDFDDRQQAWNSEKRQKHLEGMKSYQDYLRQLPSASVMGARVYALSAIGFIGDDAKKYSFAHRPVVNNGRSSWVLDREVGITCYEDDELDFKA